MTNEVICPYCHMGALRMTGRELYPAKPELANKHYHVCRNDDAWIGCVDGTWEPLGRLADLDLRRAKQSVHAAIEPICAKAIAEHGWSKAYARNIVYGWLATELDVRGTANIGEFDLKQCELVLLICEHRTPDLKAIASQRPPAHRPAATGKKAYFRKKVSGSYLPKK